MTSIKFGAYELLHELSKGGMGSVLLGRRRGPGSFEQFVAIKTIRTEYAGAQAVRAMFLDEAAILARLSHPAIATVHDFGEEGGTLYMVMEYVAGVSMRGMIGQMPPGVAARAISEACRGLHAAHELRDLHGTPLGLVHRDISPDNLMLGFDGHVKVIDFGIALVKNRQAPVTEFGTVKGKPPYMSPEQVKNEPMDRRSDVFSLGVVLHEILTGDPLFDGDSIYAVARAVEHQRILPPSHVLGRELPLGLDAAVMRALDRDPARRTPSAAEFAEDLEHVINIAGDETLEAWAARELAEPRDAHRRWLASVVAGNDAPRPIGRATHSVTALAEVPAKPATHDAPAASAQLPEAERAARDTPAHLPADGEDHAPRRSAVLPILLALALLAAIGGGIAMFTRTPETTVFDATIVASVDAAPFDALVFQAPEPDIDAAPLDAAPLDAAPLDAARIDAPRRARVDAGMTVQRDATPPVVDAPKPAGSGKLVVKHSADGSYLNVILDGSLIGVTPMYNKPIPAGTYTIKLVDPKTLDVVVTRTITVRDGERVVVEP